MAENSIITKETLCKLLDALATERMLVGPVDNGKTVEYRASSAAGILMDDQVSYKSCKEYYFPQVEKLISFTEDAVTENTEPEPVVIFGARPCDLEALRVMREVFMAGRYEDPFFARRMEANLLIGVGCTQKKPGCFCDELGMEMGFSDFCDIFLHPQNDGYQITYLSKKGRAALGKLPETANLRCDDHRHEPAAALPECDRIGIDPQTEDAKLFDAIDWKQATAVCQGCGLCTYICPTCHCFEFKDVMQGETADRFRCWDSCMYPRFTLHASGHNPRATKPERYRQRVLHKYLYVRKNTGLTACTGCGRCLRSCPVSMNIKNVVKSLMEVEP